MSGGRKRQAKRGWAAGTASDPLVVRQAHHERASGGMKGSSTIQKARRIEFAATLFDSRGWVCLPLPKSAGEKLGARGRAPVVGTIKGYRIRTSVFPKGDGTHFMLVNKEMQKGAGGGRRPSPA